MLGKFHDTHLAMLTRSSSSSQSVKCNFFSRTAKRLQQRVHCTKSWTCPRCVWLIRSINHPGEWYWHIGFDLARRLLSSAAVAAAAGCYRNIYLRSSHSKTAPRSCTHARIHVHTTTCPLLAPRHPTGEARATTKKTIPGQECALSRVVYEIIPHLSGVVPTSTKSFVW